MIGRVYLDPGSRLSGTYDPPRRCVVLTRWGSGGGPRNVAVRYLDDGSRAVIPFPRRLRHAPATAPQLVEAITGQDIDREPEMPMGGTAA